MRCCLHSLLLALAFVPFLARAADDPKSAPGYTLTPEEKKFLDLTNTERAKNNVPPLKLNLTLSKVARAHSENMLRHNKMAHILDGKNQFDRIKGAGYRYKYAGENVARGDITAAEIMALLMKSPGHRKNILNKNYTEIGIGLARGSEDYIYYTQVFASPKVPAK